DGAATAGRSTGSVDGPVSVDRRVSVEGAAAAVAPAPAPAPAARRLRLIGRDGELAALLELWRTVAARAGAAAVLCGEAGIGKTRLASELAHVARDDGGLVALAGALDLGGAAPLSLWAELIRALLPELPAPPLDAVWPEDLAVLTGELPAHFARGATGPSSVAPDLQRTRLYEAVVAMISWAARERPVLLVLDDIHTADQPSLELAGYVARRAAALPVLIVMTRRPLPASPVADQLEYALRARELLRVELELAALDDAPAAALVRSAAASLSDDQVRRAVAAAEGNPLLAVETARALARGVDEVAPSLRGSVRATLAPLAGDARRLIELAAVAGRGVALAELGALGLDDADEAAAEGLQSGLLVWSDDRIAFGHALLRDAVYEEIPSPQRPRVHERWGRSLLASEDAGAVPRPAEAARHLRLAGCYTEAVPQLARAALEARAVAALEQAAGFLEEAVGITPAGSALWLELGEVEAWRGRREAAEAAFDRAIALLADGDPRSLARAWLRKGRAYHGPICYPPGVIDCSRAALQLLERTGDTGSEDRREALAALAWSEAVAGSVEEAERLLAALSREPAGGDLATYDVGHARALALMRRGEFVASYPASVAAGESVSRAGRPDLAYGCWANAGGAAAAAGEFDRALEFLQRGVDAIAGQGLQYLEVHLLGARSFVLRRLDSLDEARICTEAEQQLAEQLGSEELIAMAAHDRGLVELARGEHELAVSLLESALSGRAPISRPLTRLALAEAYVGCGRLDRAGEELRACTLEPVGPSDFPAALVPRLTRIQGLIAAGRGDLDEARRRLGEAAAGWERLRDSANRVQSMTAVLADLGRPVVGLVEPEYELGRVTKELEGATDAVVS
ncbi:MAG: ATP-binding protein, partial [Solirubrobacteraceae bacterium]